VKLISKFLFSPLLIFGFNSCKKEDSGNPNNPSSGLPVLSTTSVTEIIGTTAKSGGTILSQGGSKIIASGICWGTSQNPTINIQSKTVVNGIEKGGFESRMSGLNRDMLYFVRSYATNSAGTSYGEERSFMSSIYFFDSGNGVIDKDGNKYHTIKLGRQEWMKENLKVSKYRNGDDVQTGLSNEAWEGATIGAYSIYNNQLINDSIYGKLYNYYAVSDPRGLCPAGWHVPTDHDWQIFTKFIDPAADTSDCCKNNAGSYIKESGLSGFEGKIGGGRFWTSSWFDNGSYFQYSGYWWSSTASLCRELEPNNDEFRFFQTSQYKYFGGSVRCLKD